MEELVGKVLGSSPPNKAAAESLRGVIGFARSHCYGRCGAIALHFLSEIVAGRVAKITPEGAELLEFWPRYLREATPRQVSVADKRRPILVFTDGAEEGEGGSTEVGVGGLIIDPEAADPSDLGPASKNRLVRNQGHVSGRFAFGGLAPAEVVGNWRATNGREKVIHQAELWPAQLAAEAWAAQLAGRKVVLFVDNDAARAALVKGATSSPASAQIVHRFWEAVTRAHAQVWVERVASAANPADGPSRNDWAWCRAKGFSRQSLQHLVAFSDGGNKAPMGGAP